jgi:hypothetical protein
VEIFEWIMLDKLNVGSNDFHFSLLQGRYRERTKLGREFRRSDVVEVQEKGGQSEHVKGTLHFTFGRLRTDAPALIGPSPKVQST